MGLDMYAYSVRRLTDREMLSLEGQNIYALSDDILCFTQENIDAGNSKETRDILPYMRQFTGKITETDYKVLKRDYNIPSDWGLCGIGHHGDIISLRFHYDYSGLNSKELTMTDFEFRKYDHVRELPCFAVYVKEVAYWRKNYELEDALYDAYDGQIQNCGWHLANEKMKSLMIGAGASIDHSDTIFYHEWY